jgi:hypothetical protein
MDAKARRTVPSAPMSVQKPFVSDLIPEPIAPGIFYSAAGVLVNPTKLGGTL